MKPRTMIRKNILMSVIPNVDRTPGSMTRRARAYLYIGSIRHLLIGIFAIGWADQFTNAAFIPIISVLPMSVWGGLMILVTLLMAFAAFTRSPSWARAALVASATLTLTIGVGVGLGVVAAWIIGTAVTPIVPILLLAIASKDYAVCTQPVRSPFEQVLRVIEQEQQKQENV